MRILLPKLAIFLLTLQAGGLVVGFTLINAGRVREGVAFTVVTQIGLILMHLPNIKR